MAELKAEVNAKKAELDTLYSDMDGVYSVQDKSVASQKELEAKLRQLEERYLAISKTEVQTRQELTERSGELEAANRALRGLTDKASILEELKSTQERQLRDTEARLSLLEKELEAKSSLLAEI